MARPRNPRRLALDILRDMKRRTAALIGRWDVSAYDYETVVRTYLDPATQQERPYTEGVRIKRRPDQYPENQAAAWAALHNETTAMIEELVKLRELAASNYHTALAAQQREIPATARG